MSGAWGFLLVSWQLTWGDTSGWATGAARGWPAGAGGGREDVPAPAVPGMAVGPSADTVTAALLSKMTGAWRWSVNTTTPRRLSGLSKITLPGAPTTSAAEKLARSAADFC